STSALISLSRVLAQVTHTQYTRANLRLPCNDSYASLCSSPSLNLLICANSPRGLFNTLWPP
ncbi:hypothetical protein ACTXT7_006813, partial [Hymenolepis weldensis]